MGTGARAMASALTLAGAGLREDGRWKYGALTAATQSDETVGFDARLREAGPVLDYAPELASKVVSGDETLGAAYRVAEARRADAADVNDLPGDLRALVEADQLDLDAAKRRAALRALDAELDGDGYEPRVGEPLGRPLTPRSGPPGTR